MSNLYKVSSTLFAKQIRNQRVQMLLPVFDGGLGESPLAAPRSMVENLKKFAHLKEYTDVRGIPRLQAALNSDNLLVGNGLKPLLYLMQLSFVKLYKEDARIFHMLPAWTSYMEQTNIIGCQHQTVGVNPDWSSTDPENWCKVTPEQMDRALSEHRASAGVNNNLVLFNNPNNPSGIIYTKQEIQDFAMVFKQHKTIVLADDIYADLVHAEYQDQFGMLANYYPEGTITGSSLSKQFGCGGYRLGWLNFPNKGAPQDPRLQDIYDICTAFASSLYSCPSPMLQHVASEALDAQDADIPLQLQFQSNMFQHIGEYCMGRFRRMGLRTSVARGAWYMLLDFSPYAQQLIASGIRTSEELGNHLASTLGLITVSCDNFGVAAEQQNFLLRYSYIDIQDIDIHSGQYCFDNMKVGINVLERWLQELVTGAVSESIVVPPSSRRWDSREEPILQYNQSI